MYLGTLLLAVLLCSVGPPLDQKFEVCRYTDGVLTSGRHAVTGFVCVSHAPCTVLLLSHRSSWYMERSARAVDFKQQQQLD